MEKNPACPLSPVPCSPHVLCLLSYPCRFHPVGRLLSSISLLSSRKWHVIPRKHRRAHLQRRPMQTPRPTPRQTRFPHYQILDASVPSNLRTRTWSANGGRARGKVRLRSRLIDKRLPANRQRSSARTAMQGTESGDGWMMMMDVDDLGM
jgi:hypothetical protein